MKKSTLKATLTSEQTNKIMGGEVQRLETYCGHV